MVQGPRVPHRILRTVPSNMNHLTIAKERPLYD
jgi:hypothetical protein